MRNILIVIATLLTIFMIWIVYDSHNDHSDSNGGDIAKAQDDSENHKSYGDTIYQYDDKTVILDYNMSYFEVSSFPYDGIITFRDDKPIDTCIIIGDCRYSRQNGNLKVTVGIDTLYYDLRHLPDTIFPEKDLSGEEVKRHTYFREFALTDSSWNCDFGFYACLPENPPVWILQLTAIIMRNDIRGMFLEPKRLEKILDEYNGIRNTSRKIDGINVNGMAPEQIARHFANEYERFYRNDNHWDNHGPKYDYMMTLSPTWRSRDRKLVTYRFYIYDYTMGAHGYMEEFYLTFDNMTGRLLGMNDLFQNDDIETVINGLVSKLTCYKELDEPFPAWLVEDEMYSDASAVIKEPIDGKYYPRPAMTKHGVVFSYQPYEAGCFAEGILHFMLPYNEIDSFLKVSR